MTMGLWTFCRRLTPAVLAIAAALPAYAQQNPMCVRLEGQLAAFDRGGADPARNDQIRRNEDTVNKQQVELDRLQARSKQLNCEGGFFLFSGNKAPECGPLSAQIQQMRANIDRVNADLSRLQNENGPEHDAQRRAILVALSQNDCGQQYKTAVASTPQPRGGLFESLFGPKSIFTPSPGDEGSPQTGPAMAVPSGSYRTLCVRTCDGYYYPISFATSPARFTADAATCQRSCPNTEVQLYTHRNPGEDVNQAVSVATQQPYTSLPTAFKYRQVVDQTCGCRRPGESWAQALKNIDDNVERGDIVVNEQRAKQLSQPRIDAQGKPIKQQLPPPPVRNTSAKPGTPVAPPPDDAQAPDPAPNRTVRSVGPTFIPAR